MKSRNLIKQLTAASMSAMMFGASVAHANIVFGDFEQPLMVVNPAAETLHTMYLWYHYPNGDLGGPAEVGVTELSTSQAKVNSTSARVRMESGAVYFQFYPKIGGDYKFLREVVTQDLKIGAWPTNTYNRLEFWVLVPEQVTARAGGRYNMTVGTYVRSSTGDRASAESGGGHFYHRFDIPYSGTWHKVVMDMHPSHERGISGNTEHGNMPHPSGEPNFNYMDLLTRFYVDFEASNVTSNPATWHFDGFRVYQETRTENEEQVYSIHGSYTKGSTPRLIVGWNRNKNENDLNHEIRYSYQDIHQIGWDNATPAPGSPLRPQGYQGYNGMLYDTTAINAGNNKTIYVAIKPANSNLFKQIALPVSDTSEGVPPSPPPSVGGQAITN